MTRLGKRPSTFWSVMALTSPVLREAPTGDCVYRRTSYFPDERSNQVSCQAAPNVLKSAPIRVVAPVLPENLIDCCRPIGIDSVAPTRELQQKLLVDNPTRLYWSR